MINKQMILVLSVLVLGVLVVGVNMFYPSNDDIEFEGVKISQEDYNSMKEINKDNMGFDVCNLNTEDCIRFINIDKAIALKK